MAIDLFSIGPFTVHGYGLMIGLGFVIAVVVCGQITKRLGLSEDDFTNIAICLLLFGFMGGKILYILVNIKQFIPPAHESGRSAVCAVPKGKAER